jgi:ABC-type antimicrobial peptide transport system permease subunit
MEWFDMMEPLLQSFWLVALPTSLIFAIQTVMTFIGGDASDGINADFDSNLEGNSAPFQLFSLRNLINFLLGFSWTGISFYTLIPSKTVLIVLSVLVGAFFIFVFFMIIKQLQRLAEDNSFKISNAINKTAEVYLSIPEKLSGRGKVMISVNGAFHELSAMTENERIQTGSVVKVVRIDTGNNLIVEPV